jgi:AMMECR1 domain-containing protein|tara:strand:+ start:147 stop:413 length:267 start_codon:yes stop_codon:yes gene_type:complete
VQKLSLEINILTPMTTIAPQAVVVEKHGPLLSKSSSIGFFLAEVAFSQAWERIIFLDELCHKAELPQGSWWESDAEFFSFESESWVEN